MKIGDEVYIHGYIDEIRNDVIIIRNKGGYFGTVPNEIKPKTEPQTDYERGRQEAWNIAQKVFDSTVTLYEAEDVAKQIAKTEPQVKSNLESFRVDKPRTIPLYPITKGEE